MASDQAKSQIQQATLALMRAGGGSFEALTVRDIAAKAGVGIGLINYHFGSKDALIRQCAQEMVSGTIVRFNQLYRSMDGVAPLEKLRRLTKLTCDYLADNVSLSRLSMLTDLNRGDFAGDNTDQTMEAYLPLVAEVSGLGMDSLTVKLRTHLLIHGVQSAFLRSASVRERVGLDFHRKEERDRLVDKLIEVLFLGGMEA